jgi:hypothetical protein
VFRLLFVVRSTALYRVAFSAASILFAAISIGWLAERLLERDLGVSDAVAPVVDLRNVLVPTAAATPAAGVWTRWVRPGGHAPPLLDGETGT